MVGREDSFDSRLCECITSIFNTAMFKWMVTVDVTNRIQWEQILIILIQNYNTDLPPPKHISLHFNLFNKFINFTKSMITFYLPVIHEES